MTQSCIIQSCILETFSKNSLLSRPNSLKLHWKYFPENLLIHHPDFSMRSILNSNIWKRLPTRLAVISCLGAPTRHLLMLHDLFQLSSMVTSKESKNFFLENFSRKPPDSCPDNLSIWVKLRYFWKIRAQLNCTFSVVTKCNFSICMYKPYI